MNQSSGKKVIFVGGTSYSGSTLLDLLLANSPNGFSCGEVYALFYPFRKHHINPMCGCGNPQCQIWPKIKKWGPKRLYQSIFDMFPEVDCIVDSSKDPLWIRDRCSELADTDIAVDNVLIWKNPLEFYQSRLKRHQEYRWESEWINYHRLYFAFIDKWLSLPYAKLVKSPAALERLCHQLRIPWSKCRMSYWEKQHHTLFGNASAKIHFHDQSSDQYSKYREELVEQSQLAIGSNPSAPVPHKEIYYHEPPNSLRRAKHKLPQIMLDIEKVLNGTSIHSGQTEMENAYFQAANLKSGYMYRAYRRAKRNIIKGRGMIAGH